MDERQLQQLIINISALHQELQKQSAEALSLQAQGVRRLEEGLSEVNRLVADEVSNQMAAVSGDLRRNIKKGSQEGLDDLRAEINDIKKHMEDFAGFSAVAKNRLDAASRSVLLKVGYLAVAALVCVIGGGARTRLVSSGGSNECFLEGFSWGEVAEGGSGAFIKFFRDCCEVGLVLGDVGAFG